MHEAVDRQLLLKQISTAEPKPPRQWNKRIPVDLETIVLKALSKDPHERYATSQELADDLRRFLEHHTIRARRPTLLQRGTKWTRRHVTALLIAVAVLLCAVIVLAASVFVVNRALSERSDALVRSERNLALALDTVNATYDRIGKEWLSKNGDLTQVQRGILEKSLKTYEAIVEQADSRPASQVQVGTAYRRMAAIHHGLRDVDAARACFEHAVQVQSALVALEPDNDDYRQELTGTYNDYGILLRTAHEWQAAEQVYQRCQQELTLIAARRPDDLDIANRLIVCAINRAALWSDQGRPADAETLLTEARTATERLARSEKGQHRLQWLTSSGLLASLIAAQGRAAEAEPICLEALKASAEFDPEGTASDSASVIGLEWQLLDTMGDILQDTNRAAEAESAYRGALKLKQRMLPYGKTPREFAMASMAHELDGVHLDPMGEHQYAYLLCKLARSLGRQGELADAEAAADEAVRTDSMLAMMYKDAAQYVEGRAMALDQLSLLQLRQDKRPEARHSAEQAVELWQQLAADSADPHRCESELSVSLCRLCWLLAGPQASDVKDIQQAAELAEEAVRLTPDRPNAWLTFAMAQYRAGRLAEARTALGHVINASPMSQALQTLLTALVQDAAGETEAARQTYEPLATQTPDDSDSEEAVWLDMLRPEAQMKFAPQNQVSDATTWIRRARVMAVLM